MTDELAALPPNLRRRLAQALDSGRVSAPYTRAMLQAALGDAHPGALAGLHRLDGLGIRDRALAAWIRALDVASAPAHPPDLVWSGPEVLGVHARDTRRVYDELVSGARRSLWMSSFAYFDGPRVFGQLARRMDEHPELNVTMLLNIHRSRRDTSVADDVVRRFADQFWGRDWPGERRPRVFYDSRSVDPGVPGVLHAKTIVADAERVLVTSANLTAAALDENIELGVLLRSRPLALAVRANLQGLIDRGLLRALPG